MRSRIFILGFIVAIMLTLTAGTGSASASGGCRQHNVQWGETLFSIGRLYNVNPYTIAAYNGISNPDRIQGGMRLCIPYGPPYPGRPAYHQVHRVQFGETLYSIGRLYNVNPYAIARFNYIINPNYLQAGMVLLVPYGPPYPGYQPGYGYDP